MDFSKKNLNTDFIPNMLKDLGKIFADDFQVKFNESYNSKNDCNNKKNDWKKEFANEFTTRTTHKVTTPAVNIKETQNTFELAVIAPGLRKEDFKLSIENNILNIASDIHDKDNQHNNEQNTTAENAEKTTENETEKFGNKINEKFSRTEFFHYKFSRSFELPESVDPDLISAKYDAGILYITLPKKVQIHETKVRNVDIA